MGFTLKAMIADCDILGKTREVKFVNGQVVIGNVDATEFLPMLGKMADGMAVEVPIAPSTGGGTLETVTETEAKEPKRVLGKRKSAGKKTSKSSEKTTKTSEKSASDSGTGTAAAPRTPEPAAPATEAASPGASEESAPNGTTGNGTASQPRSVAPTDDAEPAMADAADTEVPDGWEVDDSGTPFCGTCGASVCVCESTEAAAAEPEKHEATGETTQTPVIEVVDATGNDSEAEDDGEVDPLLAVIKPSKRVLNVVSHLIEAGFTTPDEIVERCTHFRDDVPALKRIPQSSFEQRVAKAIEITLGDGA